MLGILRTPVHIEIEVNPYLEDSVVLIVDVEREKKVELTIQRDDGEVLGGKKEEVFRFPLNENELRFTDFYYFSKDSVFWDLYIVASNLAYGRGEWDIENLVSLTIERMKKKPGKYESLQEATKKHLKRLAFRSSVAFRETDREGTVAREPLIKKKGTATRKTCLAVVLERARREKIPEGVQVYEQGPYTRFIRKFDEETEERYTRSIVEAVVRVALSEAKALLQGKKPERDPRQLLASLDGLVVSEYLTVGVLKGEATREQRGKERIYTIAISAEAEKGTLYPLLDIPVSASKETREVEKKLVAYGSWREPLLYTKPILREIDIEKDMVPEVEEKEPENGDRKIYFREGLLDPRLRSAKACIEGNPQEILPTLEVHAYKLFKWYLKKRSKLLRQLTEDQEGRLERAFEGLPLADPYKVWYTKRASLAVWGEVFGEEKGASGDHLIVDEVSAFFWNEGKAASLVAITERSKS